MPCSWNPSFGGLTLRTSLGPRIMRVPWTRWIQLHQHLRTPKEGDRNNGETTAPPYATAKCHERSSPNAKLRRDPHSLPDVSSSPNERNFRGRRPQDPSDAWSPVSGPAECYPRHPPAREPSPCSACGEQGHHHVDCPQIDCSFCRTVASAFPRGSYFQSRLGVKPSRPL
ncbi:hypothetical protein FKM82_022086 [Ascaphus truei]